jgi:ribose transport system substrate-binding protein
MSMKKVGVGVATAILGLSLVGCGTTSGNSGNTSASSTTTSSNAKSGSKSFTVGMTLMTLNNPYFVAMQNALNKDAKKDGFNAIVESANEDVSTQQSQIEDFISKKVNVIFLNAVDSKGISGGVQQAVAAGIPVIAIDVGASGGVTATIMSDNYTAGVDAGKYLKQRLGGKGNVAIINGTPITSVQDRVRGFEDALKGTQIKIVANQDANLDRNQSFTAMQNILTANPSGKLNAVFGVNDPTSLGAYLAAKDANRNNLFIVSVDGSKEAVNDIKQGGIFAETTAQYPGTEVDDAVKLAQELRAGKKIPKQVLVPVTPITKSNANSYTPWG